MHTRFMLNANGISWSCDEFRDVGRLQTNEGASFSAGVGLVVICRGRRLMCVMSAKQWGS